MTTQTITVEEWAFAFAHEAGCHHPPVYVDSTKSPDFVPENLTSA